MKLEPNHNGLCDVFLPKPKKCNCGLESMHDTIKSLEAQVEKWKVEAMGNGAAAMRYRTAIHAVVGKHDEACVCVLCLALETD